MVEWLKKQLVNQLMTKGNDFEVEVFIHGEGEASYQGPLLEVGEDGIVVECITSILLIKWERISMVKVRFI